MKTQGKTNINANELITYFQFSQNYPELKSSEDYSQSLTYVTELQQLIDVEEKKIVRYLHLNMTP